MKCLPPHAFFERLVNFLHFIRCPLATLKKPIGFLLALKIHLGNVSQVLNGCKLPITEGVKPYLV
jgi:hypothetical protein